MKILKVIHGYPMRYNAGSEVYTQTLCHSLAHQHEVHVFTREENSFMPDFHLRQEQDIDDQRITLHIVNNPRLKDRYRAQGIDEKFASVLDQIKPEIVHIGHLNHLSTSLVKEAKNRQIPIVFTLHDYWLMCPRGQFMQMFPQNQELWRVCDGQDDRKCAQRCYARYFGGSNEDEEADISYWTGWVNRRMIHVREVCQWIDIFIAPAQYLMQRFINDFGIDPSKIRYLDYGFNLSYLKNRKRLPSQPFTFGYIGTHIPAKGIQDLIQAFGMLQGDCQLVIWGRNRGQDTEALKEISQNLAHDYYQRIQWRSEYKNQKIVEDVFNQCDAIVVPSIWVENSPLVIHEAQQLRMPVITANIGGMSEYVKHEVNGLLYEHRSYEALAQQMQRFVNDPLWAKSLGDQGYLYSENGNIPEISEHIKKIEEIYATLIKAKMISKQSQGPWRITFDTNPDTCNLKCIMCEEHSIYRQLENEKKLQAKTLRIMPIEMIEQVIKEAVPHGLKEIIPSTMGEPLLYEHFEKIIELCYEYQIKMNLTTNGTFPRLGVENWAKKILPITSDIKISWNGATEATHEAIMFGSRWSKVLSNLKTLIQLRNELVVIGDNDCSITLQLTFLEKNTPELPDIVKLGIDLGVDRIKGHHLWTHFEEMAQESMRRSSDTIQRWNIAVKQAQEIAMKYPLPNGKQIKLENIFPLQESAVQELIPSGICPFLGQEAWISAKGRFNPCCAPDIQRQTLGDFGNLETKSFMEIWNGAAYQKLKDTYQQHPLCVTCNMKKPKASEI